MTIIPGAAIRRRTLDSFQRTKELYPYMTVAEIIRFSRPFFPKWRHDLERRYLEVFDLPRNQKIPNLSKGMRSKLMLLLAISRGAELLVLDEPTDGLDPVVVEEVLRDLIALSFPSDGTTARFFSSSTGGSRANRHSHHNALTRVAPLWRVRSRDLSGNSISGSRSCSRKASAATFAGSTGPSISGRKDGWFVDSSRAKHPRRNCGAGAVIARGYRRTAPGYVERTVSQAIEDPLNVLWMKGWYETRIRLLLLLAMTLVVSAVASSDSGPATRGFSAGNLDALTLIGVSASRARPGDQHARRGRHQDQQPGGLRPNKGLHGSIYYTLSLPVTRNTDCWLYGEKSLERSGNRSDSCFGVRRQLVGAPGTPNLRWLR